jgi:hypothetical protein
MKIKPIHLPEWSVPVFYLILALISFAIIIPWLGFYWDDWAQLLAFQTGGASSFWNYFSYDRPLSAWTHVVFSPIFGTSSLGWHFFSLFLRWMCAVTVWGLVRLLWPGRSWLAVLSGLFYLLYPVFSQQSIAVAYHQHWLQYLLFLFSLYSMVKSSQSSQRWKRWSYGTLALITQVLQLSISEYFLAVELLRPLIIWIAIPIEEGQSVPSRVRRVAITWMPYVLVLIGYLVWRFQIVQLPGGANSLEFLGNLTRQPLVMLPRLILTVFWDVFYMLIGSWGRVYSLAPEEITQPFILMAWLIGAAAGATAILYLLFLKMPDDFKAEVGKSGRSPFLVGIIALLLGPIPVWVLGESMLNDPDPYHADRYALAAMLGIGLLLAAVIDWLGWKRLQKAVLSAWIVFLCISFQVRAANEYRWLTTEQNRFYWQLFWRAPAPKPGTAFVTENIIFPFQGNFSTSSAINLLYPQHRIDGKMDFWLYSLLPRYSQGVPENGQTSFQTRMRSFFFKGESRQSIFLQTPNARQNCLWVLTADDLENPTVSAYYKKWLNEAYRDRIEDDKKAVKPDTDVFGPTSGMEWCYYFEKAELAVQKGEWAAVTRLGDLAKEAGFNPDRSSSDSPREWLPFIQGYALSGNWSQAADLSLNAYDNDPSYQRLYCQVWNRLQEEDATGTDTAKRVRDKLGCEN